MIEEVVRRDKVRMTWRRLIVLSEILYKAQKSNCISNTLFCEVEKEVNQFFIGFYEAEQMFCKADGQMEFK